ncbi:TRAP transporter substrate-binding protein DctP [Alkalihalobacillus sp. AL-G]|uniref:TRAP transporter substrate-binding protein DctP n=1 Tax=Alkalihalobacillus sp. AL-G TaxID=2926399 RepID=UPI00272CF604|nr:TRAP transporter substrate-binding protein DctP [Alkalihalobacillus sp. AL-G]WLD93822.1 TRAP transporter substrate-binding protein DctP [Alkalihalobacillus sp. AL-G]
MFRRYSIILMAIILVLTLMAGCKPVAVTQDGASSKTFTWQLATAWPESMFLQEIPQKWAEDIEAASGGRLKIEVHAAGELVGGGEVMDAANMGSIDAYHAATNMWIGKMPAAPFFTTIPMLMDDSLRLGWIYEGGGLELWQKMYDEQNLNIQVIPLGFTGPETLAWSNKKMESLEDWEGVKYRTAGWWGEILRNSGVSVTTTPAGEVYSNLDRGVIDAAEFATPNIDRDLGFDEVAKYYTGPGMHQPTTMYYLGVNKDAWNKLPDDLKEIVMVSARSTTLWSYTRDQHESMEANEYFLEKGVTPVKVDEETQQTLQEETVKYLDSQAEELGGTFKETWESIKDYRERYMKFKDLMVPETE